MYAIRQNLLGGNAFARVVRNEIKNAPKIEHPLDCRRRGYPDFHAREGRKLGADRRQTEARHWCLESASFFDQESAAVYRWSNCRARSGEMKSLNPPPWTPTEDAALQALVEKGLSLLQIALKLKRSKIAIGSRLKRLKKADAALMARDDNYTP